MLLRGQEDQSFELRIAGYQFPDLKRPRDEIEYWDANWLLIRIDVRHPRGSWSATDASLTAFEVVHLAEWFDALAQGNTADSTESFTEPNLSFQLVGDPEHQALRVYFELEFRPAWALSLVAGAKNLWVEFPLLELDLSAAAASLRKQLEQCPVRERR